MNSLKALLLEVVESFDELTEFEGGKPQPVKDPMFGMWLNSLKNNGYPLDLNEDGIANLVDMILKKRQTKEGIEELRSIVKEKLESME